VTSLRFIWVSSNIASLDNIPWHCSASHMKPHQATSTDTQTPSENTIRPCVGLGYYLTRREWTYINLCFVLASSSVQCIAPSSSSLGIYIQSHNHCQWQRTPTRSLHSIRVPMTVIPYSQVLKKAGRTTFPWPPGFLMTTKHRPLLHTTLGSNQY
jgi:hypothetical protein